MDGEGKSNPFGGSVDRVLLPRFPKGHQVLVAREKYLEAFVCCINGGERVEVAAVDGGGRQVFIGLLKIEPLELTYPGVSGL
jgi:hypothetical protein